MYLFLTQFFTFVKGKPPGASLSTTVFPPGAPQGREKAVLPTRPARRPPAAGARQGRAPDFRLSRPQNAPVLSAGPRPGPRRQFWGRRHVGGRVFPLFIRHGLRVLQIFGSESDGVLAGECKDFSRSPRPSRRSGSLTAPLTQGSLGRRLFFGQGRGRGPIGRRCFIEKRVFPLFRELWVAGIAADFQQRERRKLAGGAGYIQTVCRQSLSQLR